MKRNITLIIFTFTSLCLAIGLQVWRNNEIIDEDNWTHEIETKLSKEIKKAEVVLDNAIDEIKRKEGGSISDFLKTDYPVYVYKNNKILFWSDYLFVPEYSQISGNFNIKFFRQIRNDFIALKRQYNEFEIVVTIPIYTGYKIDNRYITSTLNKNIFSNQNITIDNYSQGTNAICIAEKCLFSVVFQPQYQSDNLIWRQFNLSLYVLSFLGLFLLIFKIGFALSTKSFIKGFVFLLASVFLVRYGMIFFSIPTELIDAAIFDSKVFASSKLNASFADLLFNVILLAAVSFFIFKRLYRSSIYRYTLTLGKLERAIISIVVLALFIFFFHWLFLILQTIYHNSQVTFDINETIKFNFIRVISFLILIIFSLSVFLLSHTAYRLARQLVPVTKVMIFCYLTGLLLFVLINVMVGQTFVPTITIASVLFFGFLITNLPSSLTRLKYATFLYFFSVVFSTSLLGAWSIYTFENENEINKKRKFANQFLIENDHMAEYLLADVNQKLKNDVFVQSRMASPFLSKDIVESKIRQVYLNSYFDKYEINIFLFNASGDLFSEGIKQPVDIKKFNTDEYKTGYEGIYFINNLEGNIAKRYIDYVEIKKRGLKVGYIVMDMKLKRIIPDNVYPELLVDNRFLTPYEHSNYSYAVFQGDEITYSSGDFNYKSDLTKDVFVKEASNISFAGYSHIIFKVQSNRTIVVSSNTHPFSDLVSNFSFLFLLQVFVVLLFSAVYTLYYAYHKIGLNYSTRIQLYLNAAFFLPLFAVSITTLSLINASFHKEVIDEYYKRAEDVGNNLNKILEDYVKDIADADELKSTVTEIAKFSNTDINIFNTKGKLLASSQPAIYENNLLSEYINPQALDYIVRQGNRTFTTNESVGTLKYNSTYFGVKAFDTGDPIGIVSIPFFQSEYALEHSQISVITSILNIFTIVFIVFLILSFFTAKWLTFPLAFITQKLRKTSLTEFNEPLTWNTDDEIGLMVGEYNRMLINLEESKRALARSEKQSAWREIAQQVAHEIKNPLTPMKLTLQHLSRKLMDEENDVEKSRPINMLLKQIDTLDDIASSFSSFAKMPIPESERFEFKEVLKNSVNLHSTTEGVTINLQMVDELVYTLGDQQQMGRIVSNLLLNAIQAQEGNCIKIDIILTTKGEKLLLSVADNGPGIAEEIQAKIFIPNFTTKDTGSGIGLAIAKHGIEHAGGNIWFESVIGTGATFFIELPIIR